MIGKRYDLVDELRKSSTGVVYLAEDRLTGARLALKHLTAPGLELTGDGQQPAVDGGETSAENRLPLARKLQLLASLRHRNIIGVLDYGFDREMRPYYTTELLEDPLPLLEAGDGQSIETRIDFLLQTLRALTYLHHRGVSYVGLEPEIVLVEDQTVRLAAIGPPVLRFVGEPGARSDSPYLAPEVLAGGPGSPAADLYAVGILACELLSGQRVDRWPDAAPMRDIDRRWVPVFERLIADDLERRYQDAAEVIHDLLRAPGSSIADDGEVIVESLPQALRLVGREDEMARLRSLLAAAVRGRGGTLLIAGESGAGKSRLLEELRPISMAAGASVLRARAVGEGFDPYQPWRQILRQLCLLVEVDESAAAVLKTQIPDLEQLLGRPVEDAPTVEPRATQRRFSEAVEGLFRRIERPTVVLLEDLHLASSASLALLAALVPVAAELPLLMIGAYRGDERPDLSAVLDGMPLLELERLPRQDVAELAESMLGEVGRREELVDFLDRVSRGNAFFLVEVIRALVAEAGRPDRIDPADLPEQISTGGIQTIIQHRLERLPRRAWAALRLAAVAGRGIDLKLLKTLEPGLQPELWLRMCSDLAVLEVVSGSWRFVHEQMREALLHDRPAAERRKAHRRVAEAIMTCYGRASAEHAPALAHHWTEAADVDDPEATRLAVEYLERAGSSAMASCALEEARRLLSRGLALHGTLPASGQRMRQEIHLQIGLGGTYLMSEGFAAPEVGRAFSRARNLCEQTGESAELMPVLLGLWRFHLVRGELEASHQLAQELVRHARESRRSSHRVLAEYALGVTLFIQGKPGPAAEHLSRCIDLYGKLRKDSQPCLTAPTAEGWSLTAAVFYLGQHPGVSAFGTASLAYWCRGYPDHALALNRRGLALAEELDHPFTRAFVWTARAWLDQLRNDPAAAEESARAAIELCREMGFTSLLDLSIPLHGWARAHRGDAEQGLLRIRQALDETRSRGSELFRPYLLALLAETYGLVSRPAEGLAVLEEAVATADELGSGWWKPEIHRLRGELYLMLPRPDLDKAERCFSLAVSAARKRREKSLELRAQMSLVRLWQEKDRRRHEEARAALDELYHSFSEGFETADLVAAHDLL